MDLKKQAAIDLIEAKADKIAGIADRIWEYAELSLQEFQSWLLISAEHRSRCPCCRHYAEHFQQAL